MMHRGAVGERSPIARLAHLRVVVKRRSREVLHRRGVLRAAAYVMEYPKSGGSWVSRMVTDLVAIDAARPSAGKGSNTNTRTPRPVRRDHWRHSPHLRPAIYVVRDGRDVAVSLYFYHQRELTFGGERAKLADAYLREILGDGYDMADSKANLPAFIRSLNERPFGGLLRRSGNRRLLGWPAHIADWIDRPNVLVVRYEDLLEDTGREMGRVAGHLGLHVTDQDLTDLAARHSFEATSGRRPGQEDRVAHQRKGIAGDWRNHFTREAGEAFLAYGGSALIALGYAEDDGWVT